MSSSKTKDKLVIVASGGSGRFGSIFKKVKSDHKFYFPTKKKLNILNIKSIENYLKKIKPDVFIHLAGLSRPMEIHEKNYRKSIELNIIGTANVTCICSKLNIKLIYFSTNFVYPGTKGSYKESDDLNPLNKYGWSKLGGEAAVKLYDNSLILRVCMTEEPFVHKSAFYDVKTNFEFHKNIAPIVIKLINQYGVINIGGKAQTVYNFAKNKNLKVKKIFSKKVFGKNYPTKQDMNINKMKKLLKS